MNDRDARDPRESKSATEAAQPPKRPPEKHPREKQKDGKEGDKHKEKDHTKEVYKENYGKEGTKEVYKENYGKELSKDSGKGESKDIDLGAFVQPLVDLHRRVAVLEAAVGIGAPFIEQDERPAVGETALSQPLHEDER